jgi:hypothetical protein
VIDNRTSLQECPPQVETDPLFSRQAAEIERQPAVRSLADEQGVAADVAAELDRGELVVALLADSSRPERSNLLDRLCAHLAWKSTRVIRIGGLGDGPVDVRRFCHLLIAASSAGAIVSDPAEHLASILTTPRAGERSLTLIVENADALSTDALAFVARLAAVSSAQPLRMQVLLLGSHALRVRLAGVGPVAVKWLDGLPVPNLKPLPTQQRTRRLRLALAAVGCLAGVVAIGTIRSGDNDRLFAKAGSAVEAPPAPAVPFAAFAVGEESSRTAPSESTSPHPPTNVGRSVPRHSKEFSSTPTQVQSSSRAPPEGAASLPVDVVPRAGKAVSGHAPERQTTTASPSTEPLPQPEFEGTPTTVAELPARSDALLTKVQALLARSPTEGAAPPDTGSSASPATLIEPPPTPLPAAETAFPSATTAAAALPATGAPAVPIVHAEPLPAPVQPAETAVPSTAAAADDARPAAEPSAVPIVHAEPLPAPVQPAETAVPSTAAAASAAQSAAKPQRPLSGASPAAVAALLARGDALIAIGDVATARLVYQRAAAHASARAATATGKTYDRRFLQAIGAIGVVADPDAAAAWYRKGAALGDEDAAPLLGGLDVKASQ